jgi:hypothetical protein
MLLPASARFRIEKAEADWPDAAASAATPPSMAEKRCSKTAISRVETDAEPTPLARFTSEVDRRCPVSQLYRRSGVDVTSHWTAQNQVRAGGQ